MSTYLQRSEESLECAKFLNNSKRYFVSLFHCSYYSVFQLSKYIVDEVLSRDEESLEAEKKYKGKRDHELINSLIVKELGDRSALDALEFNKYWNILKQYRVDADYKNKDFEKHDFGIAIGYAENLSKQLKQKFGVR